MSTCPTCGQEVAIVRGLEVRAGSVFSTYGSLQLGPIATGIVRVLIAGPLTTQQLIEQVYCYASDSPEFPRKAINVTVSKLRRFLPTIGWTIANSNLGSGGGVYQLMRTVPRDREAERPNQPNQN
jgi:hypothetical protein